ncbi:MAG: metal ABC transporter ATP-binding protein [Treponema sp.]|nr:metal ABC transporter ATP-binding protein [Treponema sp.]
MKNYNESGIIVSFESVSFSYGNVKILENASFHIHNGEFVAMVGANGSGKTTVLKLLLGFETPTAGCINIFENNFAYVSQYMPSDNLFPITVRDIVRMGLLLPSKRYPRKSLNDSVCEAMEKTGVSDIISRSYMSLSGGQKRRTLVARALAAKPKFLVLDEPAANMDMESEASLYETLGAYKGKTTILIVTHNTEFVTPLTDRVLCLGNGYNILQHQTEKIQMRSCRKNQDVRVLHNENISCC